MDEIKSIEDLGRDKLLELLNIYAKNWLAHDGCWFQAIEEKLGIDLAIDFDREAWRKFTTVEANRIIEFLNLPDNLGISGLAKALRFRLYSTLNEDRIEIIDNKKMIYYVKTCRVQLARRRKGLADFPCQSVGIIEYSYFAKTIDSRIVTKSISCPPNISDKDNYCVWEFSILD